MNYGNKEDQGIDWISPCPVVNCKNKNKYYRWTHQQCGGTLLLNIKGEFVCNKCNIKKLFKEWFFHCGSHQPEETSKQGASEALNSLSKLIVKKSKEKIISQLIKAVLNQFQVAANNNNNDVTEIDFITACPVHECINFKEIYTWKHPNGNCKGKLRLTQEGTIRCTQCSNKWEIVKWEFECPNHKGKQKPTAQGLCHAVNCTSNDIHSIATFAAKCIGAIMSKIEND